MITNTTLQTDSAIDAGWLSIAKRLPSPNYNQRPDPTDIRLLVLHNISLPPEQFGDNYIEQFFCNRLEVNRHPFFHTIATLRVSAHLLITRKGDIIQFVPFNERAWHAGESCYQGVNNCNDFSIGIELEGSDNLPYSQRQYRQLVVATRSIMQVYPGIDESRILGHSDIAPGRKTDPGPAFDWQYYRQLLAEQV